MAEFGTRHVWMVVVLAALWAVSTADAAPWWDGSYANRNPLTVTAGTNALSTNYSVFVTLDHAALVGAGDSLASGDDVRIVYWNGASHTELDRICDATSSWNSVSTKIWFRLPAAISASGADAGYGLYYNNAAAGSPPAVGTNVFDFWDDFSGSVLDSNKWQTVNSGTITVSGGRLEIDGGGDWWNTAEDAPYVVSKTQFTSNYMADARVVVCGDDAYNRFFGLRASSNTTARMFCLLGDDNRSSISTVYRDSDSAGAAYQGNDTAVSHTADQVAAFTRVGDLATAYYGGSTVNSRSVASWALDVIALTDTQGGDSSQFDWVRVRKYVVSDGAITAALGVKENEDGSPYIINLAPTNIVSGEAFLNGMLISTGAASVTAISVYWGTSDGLTSAANWANTNSLVGGPWGNDDTVTTNITTLPVGQDVFYTYFASNSSGGAWAVPSKYLSQGELTFSVLDATCGVTVADTATVLVSRASSCTGGALTVYYTTSGDATNGADYTASPASGSLVMQAGETNAVIAITPKAPWNHGAARTFTVTLAAGVYRVGSPDNAGCTLASMPVQTYTWDGSTVDWADDTHWTGGVAGLLPANGDTGIVASGQAQVTTGSSELYDGGAGETAPAAILIKEGGTLYFGYAQTLAQNHNLVLDGGMFYLRGVQWSQQTYGYDVSVRSNSTIYVYSAYGYGGAKISGSIKPFDAGSTGRVTVTGTGYPDYTPQLVIGGDSSTYTNGWSVSEATLSSGALNALGSGPITVSSGAVVWAAGGDDPNMPSVTVRSGGSLMFNNSARFDVASGEAITIEDGGTIGMYAVYTTTYVDAPLYVSGNVTFRPWSTMYLEGDIINTGATVITTGGGENFRLTKLNNVYTGDWRIPYSEAYYGPMAMWATANGAMGRGGLIELGTNSSFGISQSLTLYNTICGDATLNASAKTLTLAPVYTNATLYGAGVSPGTNWGAAIGTIAVTGNLTCTNLLDYSGSSDAYSQLTIDVGGTVADPTNDMLTVSGDLAGLANVDLVVNVGVSSAELTGQTLELKFVTAQNALTPSAFHSVSVTERFLVTVINGGPTELVLSLTTKTGTTFILR